MANFCGTLLFFLSLIASFAQTTTLPSEDIAQLIPDRLKGFHLDGEAKARMVTLGTIRYSLSEKSFVTGSNKHIKILLFDFKEAPIMYAQATRKFNAFTPIESDSLVLRSLSMTNCTGWETYNSTNNSSQIAIGVCDRFFLTAEGTNVNLDVLKQLVRQIEFENFPR
jgi:hypothetical protein